VARIGDSDPALIVLEGAYWIDANTLNMMMRLADSIARAMLLAVVSARPGRRGPAGHARTPRSLHTSCLAAANIIMIVCSRTGRALRQASAPSMLNTALEHATRRALHDAAVIVISDFDGADDATRKMIGAMTRPRAHRRRSVSIRPGR